MNDSLLELQDKLNRAKFEHCKLVWVVGGNSTGRHLALRSLADVEQGVFVELGKKLSAMLLDIPAPLRTASLSECFLQCLASNPSQVTCIDHLEILFEPQLRINPVALLEGASRHTPIVAAWPGQFEDGNLVFGGIDHPSHIRIPRNQFDSNLHMLGDPI